MAKLALVGNPNSGKTTLFNSLTGATAHVGNWPGVTVEKRVGKYKLDNQEHEVIDLPGIYSLSPYTDEEVITRNFLLHKEQDVVINIIDATNLERSLYLTTQILEVDVPMIIALNMMDTAAESGMTFDVDGLIKLLGVPVVPISALKNQGLSQLVKRALAIAKNPRVGRSVLEETSLAELYTNANHLLTDKIEKKNQVFHVIKFIEGDQLEVKMHPELSAQVQSLKDKEPVDAFEGDFAGKISDARYQYITNNINKVRTYDPETKIDKKSEKIDKVLTHRIWGIPLFFLIMLSVFHIVFSENFLFLGALIPDSFNVPIIGAGAINSPGVMLQGLVELLTETIGGGLSSLLTSAPAWLNGLLVDGIWAGLSAVLSFIPQIIFLFFFIALLEDTGYMSRAAFIMDRSFRKLGLSGRSFVPLLMSFGCTVPGILATRTLENRKEKFLTIILTPFFSCGAKLPIWAAFAAVLYGGQYPDLIVFGMYLLGIVVALIAALYIKRITTSKETSPFIMELPVYRRPQARNLALNLWDKLKGYLVRASTIVALAIVVIWLLSSFTFTFAYVTDISQSMLGQFSKIASYIFMPLGWGGGENGWMFTVAAFTGLIAKEMVPATLGTFGGMSESALIGTLAIPAAFSFMAFNLLTVPCMATVSAARAEIGNRKKFAIVILTWIGISLGVSAIIYWTGTYLWLLPIAIAIVIVPLIILYAPKKKRQV